MPPKRAKVDMNTVCRVCLTVRHKNMFCIFGVNPMGRELWEMLSICTDVTIKPDDGFPPCICELCIFKLESLYHFRNLCRDSNKHLRYYISGRIAELPLQMPNPNDYDLDSDDDSNSGNIIVVNQPPNAVVVVSDTEQEETEDVTPKSDGDDSSGMSLPANVNLNSMDCDGDYLLNINSDELPDEEVSINNKKDKSPDSGQEAGTSYDPMAKKEPRPDNDLAGPSGSNVQAPPQTKTSEKPTAGPIIFKKKQMKKKRVIWICGICCGHSHTKEKLKIHHQSHYQYKCNDCGLKCDSLQLAKFHSFKHDLEACEPDDNLTAVFKVSQLNSQFMRLLVCRFCKKEFNTPRSLKLHLRFHSGKKTATCPFCDHKFCNSGILQNHTATVHKNPNIYKCSFCPKAFNMADLRNKHERIHTEEKPYECDMCFKLFASMRLKNEHRNRHTKELKSICKMTKCEKENVQRKRLVCTPNPGPSTSAAEPQPPQGPA